MRALACGTAWATLFRYCMHAVAPAYYRFVENLCTSLVCLQVLVLPNMASLEALVESKKQIQDAKGTGAASKQRLASRKSSQSHVCRFVYFMLKKLKFSNLHLCQAHSGPQCECQPDTDLLRVLHETHGEFGPLAFGFPTCKRSERVQLEVSS